MKVSLEDGAVVVGLLNGFVVAIGAEITLSLLVLRVEVGPLEASANASDVYDKEKARDKNSSINPG